MNVCELCGIDENHNYDCPMLEEENKKYWAWMVAERNGAYDAFIADILLSGGKFVDSSASSQAFSEADYDIVLAMSEEVQRSGTFGEFTKITLEQAREVGRRKPNLPCAQYNKELNIKWKQLTLEEVLHGKNNTQAIDNVEEELGVPAYNRRSAQIVQAEQNCRWE